MLEKTGAVALTKAEFSEANSGELPSRIKDEWGLSLEELQGIIRSGNYTISGGSKNVPKPWKKFDNEDLKNDSDI